MTSDTQHEAKDQAEFEAMIVKRYLARSDVDEDTAKAFAAAFFEKSGLDLEFGDPDYDWTQGGADTLADEDMSYWECEE